MCSGTNNGRSVASLTEAVNSFSADEKGYVSDQDRQKILLELRKKNRLCFDCSSRNPSWLSITYAIFLCLNCSGKHRQKGVHISFVRSAEMDKFTKEQLIRLILGGNSNAGKYFNEHGIDQSGHIDYLSKHAAKYASHLDALVKPYTLRLTSPSIHLEEPINTEKEGEDGDLLNLMDTRDNFTSSSPSTSTSGAQMNSSIIVNTKTKLSLSSNKVVPELSCNAKSNQTNNSFSAGKTFGSRKLDFDFDFNEAALMASQSNSTCSGSKIPSANIERTQPLRVVEVKTTQSTFSHSVSSQQKIPSPKSDMSQRFKNSKSISSDHYFQDDGAKTSSSNVNNFGSSRSISSDAYFNRNTDTSSSFNENKPIQLEDLKETALNSINSLKATGSDMLLKAKNWLST